MKYETERKLAYRRFIEIVQTKERMNNINSTQNIVTQYLKPKNR